MPTSSISVDTDTKTLAEYRAITIEALQSPRSQAFYDLMDQFRDSATKFRAPTESSKEDDIKSKMNLWKDRKLYLDALTMNISYLGQPDCSPLITVVLGMPVSRVEDKTFWKSYLKFMENLVSAHSFYVSKVLRRLLKMLRYGPEFEQKKDSDESGDLMDARAERFYRRIHVCIRKITIMVPSCVTSFGPIIAELFPHKRQSLEVHERFTRHLLQIVRYIPLLSEPIFEIIMERLVQIDVEVTLEMDDLEEEEEEFFHNIELQCDDSDFEDAIQASENQSTQNEENAESAEVLAVVESEDDDEIADMEAQEDRETTLTRMKMMLSKLDKMLLLVFEYLQYISETNNTSEASPAAPTPQMANTFQIFIQLFDRFIMRTHKCKYSQSLIFFVTTWHPSFGEALISLLLMRMFDSSLSPYLRCTAAAYFASFLSRAHHISPKIIAHCLKISTEWIHSALDRYEPQVNGPCPSKFPVFYSAVQAVLYVFCFRWRELTGMEANPFENQGSASEPSHKRQKLDYDDDDTTVESNVQLPNETGASSKLMEWWRMRGGFQRVVFSKLNPLLVCSKAVVQEFDCLANDLQLMYCSSLITVNRHSRANTPDQCNLDETIGTIATYNNKGIPTPPASPPPSFLPPDDGSASASIVNNNPALNIGEVIESFFPFDPYYRHLSIKKWIEKYYLSWRSSRPAAEDDDEEEDDEEDFDDPSVLSDADTLQDCEETTTATIISSGYAEEAIIHVE